MTRPLRIEVANGCYHVTARGNAKEAIYYDDVDRRTFLKTLERTLWRYDWRCLAYCLMGNHYHLLVRTVGPNLATGMRELNGVYAQAFNRRHDRPGHVFQGRYASTLVERDAHLLEAARYIARNPVTGGLCQAATDWAWSSHCEVLGLRPAGFVAVGELLSHFNADPSAARRQYRAFVSDGEGDVSNGHDPVIGTDHYVESHLPVERPSPEIGRRAWHGIRPPLAELLGERDVDEAIATAFHRFGYRMIEIADALGWHYSTVSRRLRRWEGENGMPGCTT